MNPSEYLRQTKELITSIQTRFLELGARLYKIHEEKLWEGLFDSYPEFLEAARISESQASIFANIHKHYVLDGGIKEETLAKIGYSNLHTAMPLIESKGVEKAVVDAMTLTREEIKDNIRGLKFGDKHLHTPSEALFSFCSVCKKLVRVEPHIETDGTLKSNLEGFTLK